MMAKSPVRVGVVSAALATAFGLPTASVAAPPAGDITEIELPAGVACAGFDLGIQITANPNRPELKEFVDESGKVVRSISAGRGTKLVFTNLATPTKTLSLRPNGSVSISRVNPDGTTTVSNTGHNVLVLFPTDVPPGPSTILYVGRLVYTVDANDVFTVQTFNGTTMDICAALT
jgi:hypothetical protein